MPYSFLENFPYHLIRVLQQHDEKNERLSVHFIDNQPTDNKKLILSQIVGQAVVKTRITAQIFRFVTQHIVHCVVFRFPYLKHKYCKSSGESF